MSFRRTRPSSPLKKPILARSASEGPENYYPRLRVGLVFPRAARVVLGLVALLTMIAPRAASAALVDDAVSYSILCRLELDRDPALTARLEEAIKENIQKAFQAILGSEHKFQLLAPEVATLFPSGPLENLELEAIGAKSWAGRERLLFVYAGRQANGYVLQAREFDPQFQILGPVCEMRTMQREMVPGVAGHVVLQAFTPTADVRAVTGTHVEIEFRGDSRLRAYRSWLGLDGNVGLQVMREPIAAGRSGIADEGGNRATRYRRSFLALRSWDAARAECDLIGPDVDMFRDLTSASVRYLARPVRAGARYPRIQVIRKGTRQPHEGCEVFASAQQYSTEPSASRGLTDRSGFARFDAVSNGIQFVAVRHEDLVIKAPLLPGASNDPMVFELPTRGRRADFVRPLKQIYQELEDQELVDVRLAQDLKAKAEAREAVEVRKLVDRGKRKRITLEEVLERVREIEARARTEGEDVSLLAADVREAAAKKCSKQVEQLLTSYGELADRMEKDSIVRDLSASINELQGQMDWVGLVPLYEKLVAAAPDKPEHAAQLRRLQSDLKIKSPEHGRARTFANEPLKEINTRELASRWQEVERAAHTLLGEKDHLTLLKVRRSLNTWARDLALEVRGLIDQIQAAGQDEDRVQELRVKLDRLDDLNQSLQKLHKEVNAFLEKLDL